MASAAELALKISAQDLTGGVLDKVNKQASTFSSTLAGIGKIAAGFGLATIGLNAVASATSMLGDSFIGLNDRLQQAKIAFTTMLGSAQAADVFLEEMARFAAQTPFEFPELIQAAQRMMAYGFTAQQVKPMLEAVGNASAGLGAGSEGINILTRALGQMQAKGKVMGQELLQLQEAGIKTSDVYEVVAKKLGKTTEEVVQMQEKGQLASDVFIESFQEWSKLKFGDMMGAQAKTFSGAMSTIKDSTSMAMAKAFKPLFDLISEVAVAFANFVSSNDFSNLADQISNFVYATLNTLAPFAGKAIAIFEVVLSGLGALASGFSSSLGAILDIVVSIGQMIYEALSWLNPFASHSPSLVSQVEQGVAAILRSYEYLASAADPIEEVADAVQDFGANNKEVERTIKDLTTSSKGMESDIKSLKSTMDTIKDAISATKDKIDDFKNAIKASRDAVRDLANAQLFGTRAYKDQLDAISIELDKLQLQAAKLKLGGVSKDDKAKQEALKALEDQMDALRIRADEVRLAERLELDPLRKQIKELADPIQELSFDEVVSGIMAAKLNIAALEPELAATEQLWNEQNTALKEHEAALKVAQQAWDTVKESISSAKDVLSEMNKELAEAKKAAGGGGGGGGGVGGALAGLPKPADILGGAVENIKETVNDIKKVTEGIKEAKEAFTTNISGIKSAVKEFFDPIQEGFSKLKEVVATSGLKDIVTNLRGVFSDTAGSGLELHNALEKLVGLDVANFMVRVVNSTKSARAEMKGFADDLGPLIEPAMANIRKITEKGQQEIEQAWQRHDSAIMKIVNALWTGLEGFFGAHWAAFRGGITTVLAVIAGDWEKAWDSMLKTFSDIWDNINKFGEVKSQVLNALFEMAWDTMFSIAKAAWEKLQEIWEILWERIKEIGSDALNGLQDILSSGWETMQSLAGTAWDAFKALIQAVWDALLAYITSQIEKLKADLSSAWETIKSVAETAWNLVRTTVENVWKALQKAIDEFLETIQTNIEKVWKAIQTKTAEVWQAMRNKIDEMIKSILGIFEGYIKAINGVIGAVGGLLDWISKIPSFVKMPDILPGKVVAPPGAPPGSEPGAPPEEVMEGVARALGIGAMSLRAFGAVVDSFKTKLKELIEGIAALAGEMNNNPMIIISAKAFSEGVLPIVDFVSKATSALIELRKVRALTIETFDALREGIKGVITALASLAGGWEGVSPDAILGAKAFAQAVGPAFEAISKAIDVLGKLKDYSQIGKAHVTGFINNIVEMIEQLVEISGAWDDGILEMVKVFTGVVGPAIADIGKGFELLEKLKDYSQIGKEHARGFINNLVEIVDHLAEIAGAWSVELQDSMALISETIGKVVSGIAPGIELLAKLKDYAQIGQVHIQGFINNLVEIVDLMAGIAGVWERELQEKIQLISDTIDKIASGLEGSLDMFEKLKDYSQIAKEHGQGLVNNLVELMDLFAGIANVWPEDLQEKIKKLLTTMDEIVDTLIKASGLKDLTPMTEQVLAFRDAIVALLQEVGAGFTEMVNEVRLNLVALADAFSESVSSAWAWSGELVKAIDDVVVALAKLPVGALVPSTATPLIGTPGGGYTSNSVNNSSVVNVGTVNMSNNNNIQEAILMMNLLAVPRR